MVTVPVAQTDRYRSYRISESNEATSSHAFLSLPKSSSLSIFSTQFPLLGEIKPGWMLIRLLPLTLEEDDDGYIVSDDRFLVYGDGDTPAEALQDYIEALVDYHEILSARSENDPSTQALFHQLRSYLLPTS
jgi:hypothetical protein